MVSKIQILGISFINEPVQKVVDLLKDGGLLVVPAAPALVNIQTDQVYFEALKRADVVIADSGYMALLWNLFKKPRIIRISGLEFLRVFFTDSVVMASRKMLLVNPTPKEAKANIDYLNNNGFNIRPEQSYLAPMYDKNNVTDSTLLQLVEEQRPDYILINIGGGTQEKLGAWLQKNLSYKPAIICTGAAIAFLTGQQANIPHWADKLYLGWLMRCIANPKLYIPRYWNSFKLAGTLLRFGSNSPV